MDEVNVYLAELIKEKKLSYREAEFFVDYAYEMCLNDFNDEDIESIVTKEINKHIEGQ